jgi:tetratricopeptide (TPR) repeat protein
MTDRSQLESTLNGSNRHCAFRSQAKFLAFCLFFSQLVVTLSENALGGALGKPAQQSAQAPRDAGNKADDEREALPLEAGKAIRRILTSADSHTYQIRLSAGQFLNVIIEQQGIDVVVQLSGSGGEQIAEFDGEGSSRGRELAWLVAETEDAYRLTVRSKRKDATTAGYEIRIGELRNAIGDDYALQGARNLFREGVKLLGAGKYEEALPLVERSLETRERVLGPEHLDVAEALNGLGALYFRKGEYAKAEPLYQRALTVRERALGPEHPLVAASHYNLATLYKNRGDYAKAEPLYLSALAIMEKALGQEHPLVGESLNGLAILYNEKGDYAKSEQFYLRALNIKEKSLGPQHPNVALSLNNLANTYYKKGDYAKAEQVHHRALDIWEKSLGPQHPHVAQSLNNLANTYYKKGDYEKAEQVYHRSLNIKEKSLGPQHPDVA